MVGNHQTSIYKWLFGVPGTSYILPLSNLIWGGLVFFAPIPFMQGQNSQTC